MPKDELLLKAGDIVSSYASRNETSPDQLIDLLGRVAGKLFELAGEETKSTLVPAVPIEESVTDDYIVCLEDGKKVSMLARHLKRHHDMTPEEYRERWGLPEEYPFVTKSYSEKRSQIAKDQGLGKAH